MLFLPIIVFLLDLAEFSIFNIHGTRNKSQIFPSKVLEYGLRDDLADFDKE
jgi:hypothetical protein